MTTNAADVICVENLRKHYRLGLFGRGVEALRGVTLSVGKGEIFALLGPNGAGKTTLIKVLLGIIRASGGNATMLSLPAGDRRGRARTGHLPENLRIQPHHTARSALDLYGHLTGMSRAEIHGKRDRLLSMVGLTGRDRESVKRFSKGMRQRLGLALALLHDPELLILDEPTDGLDPVGRSQVRTLLQQLRDEGRTVFLNSHLLQEVELVCDHVAILDNGRLKYQGTIEDLTPDEEGNLRLKLAGELAKISQVISSQPLPAGVTDGQPFEITVAVPNQSETDRLVDQLRAAGVSIFELEISRRTLEDAFLALVSSNEPSLTRRPPESAR